MNGQPVKRTGRFQEDTLTFTVTLKRPLGANKTDVQKYIKEAIKVFRFSPNVSDPMGRLKPETVKVKGVF